MKKTLSIVACATLCTLASANNLQLDKITVDGATPMIQCPVSPRCTIF